MYTMYSLTSSQTGPFVNPVLTIMFLGGDSVVSCPRGLARLSSLFLPSRHMECGVHLCRDGHKETTLPWRFRDRPALQDIQVYTVTLTVLLKLSALVLRAEIFSQG